MRYLNCLLLALAILCPWTTRAAEPFVMPSPLPEHPRLIVSKADWTRLRGQLKSGDPDFMLLFNTLEKHGKTILTRPLVERVMIGKRMLGTSVTAGDRVMSLSMLANLTDDPAYARRAIDEMRAVCAFADWNPSHFLDVAEMSLAVAVGYDWLYDKLSPEDRATFERALVEKGIQPSIPAAGKKAEWWITGDNNWTQVCHGGLSAAAIALADREPQLAAQILERAVANMPKAVATFAPDGVCEEGPGYWGYGTSFHVLLAAALQRFCGNACGLDTLEGFPKTPLYVAEMTGPSDMYFNYSDCGTKRDFIVPMFWFAKRFGQPGLQQAEMERLKHIQGPREDPWNLGVRIFPYALLWYDAGHASGKVSLPLQWLGKGKNPVVAHRSAFGDKEATFVALKGGSPSCSHAHMDGGTFVMEADGVRWAIDLGSDDYTRLETSGVGLWDGRQEGQRWDIFRLGPEGHSILRFNGAKQAVKGDGQFVRFHSDGAKGSSVADITSLYPGMAKVWRGVALLPSRAVLFQDEWKPGSQAVDAAWQWITKAEVKVIPGGVELTQDGKRLTLRILAPANAEVEVKPTQDFQQWMDANNPGVKRITIKARTEVGKEGTFRVLAIPGSCGNAEAPAVEPLEKWPGRLD